MFRMESESEEGKMTYILRNDLGMMYQINWRENIVINMSLKELEKMRIAIRLNACPKKNFRFLTLLTKKI